MSSNNDIDEIFNFFTKNIKKIIKNNLDSEKKCSKEKKIKKKNKEKKKSQKQKLLNSKKIVIMLDDYFADLKKFFDFCKNKNTISNDVVINLLPKNYVPYNEYMKLYNIGYRYFISTSTSSNLIKIINFFKIYTDAFYINLTSTVVFDTELPFNMIRTSVNDLALSEYIFERLNSNLLELLKISNILYFRDFDKVVNKINFFNNITYIYTNDTYSINYVKNFENKYDIKLKKFLIENSIPDELKDLMLNNNVGSENFKNNNMTFFIITLEPQKILDLLDNELYHNNFFIFGDTFFFDKLVSKYKFKYAFVLIGSFSYIGYKLSKFVEPKQNLSPQALYSIDIINTLKPFIEQYNQLNKIDFVENLKSIEFINNNKWYENKIFGYQITYQDNSNIIFPKTLFLEHKFNSSILGIIENNEPLFILFYIDWSGWVQRFKPEWYKFVSEYSGKVKILQYEVGDIGEDLLETISGYPTLRLYPNGIQSRYIDYTGERTSEALIEYLNKYFS